MFVSSLSSLPLLCFVPTTGTHFWRFLSSLLSLQRQRTPCFGVVEVVSLPLVSLISFVGIFDFEVFSYHYSFDVRNPFLVCVVIHFFFFLMDWSIVGITAISQFLLMLVVDIVFWVVLIFFTGKGYGECEI